MSRMKISNLVGLVGDFFNTDIFSERFSFFEYHPPNQMRIIGIISFLVLFLLLFNPFGIIEKSVDRLIFLAIVGFAAVSGLVVWIFFYALPVTFKPAFTEMTVGKAILYLLFFFLCLVAANYFYKSFLEGFDSLSLSGFLVVAWRTFLIALVPVSFTVIWQYRRRREMQQTKISIISENQNERLILPLHQLLFVEKADNYVEVHYLENNRVQKKLIRQTLTNLEQQAGAGQLIRCHRSYLVNLQHVKHAKGNSRGFRLYMHNHEKPIPVSRKYIHLIQKKLELVPE